MKTELKLGTRTSLLAWAQSSWVARELVKKHHGRISVQLVGIETQGDKILDKPLSQIEGKEFFTAELDHALLRGEVDFTVHSMKDLSLDRPSSLKLAATPPRELSHDVAIFHRSVIERLQKGLPIRVGTSSPRRLTLVPAFLKKALPHFGGEPSLKFVEIRGNVNTRLSRVHEDESSPKKLDAVILAFAGLERLAQDEKASVELGRLMQNTLKMILPLRENPTAPAQGALAIEARLSEPETLKILSVLDHPETLSAVQEERAVLGEWGGGCHQKLGASFFKDSNSEGILLIKGEKPNGEKVTETRGQGKDQLPQDFLKVETEELFSFTKTSWSETDMQQFQKANAVFIAHIRAYDFLPANEQKLLAQKAVWVSGMKTWEKLALAGVWVEGCTEGLGIKNLPQYIQKNFFNQVESKLLSARWVFLTHQESLKMNPHFNFSISPLATYSHQFKSVPEKIKSSQKLFWSSGLAFTKTFESLTLAERSEFLKKTHACGPGRTQTVLTQAGIKPEIYLGAN